MKLIDILKELALSPHYKDRKIDRVDNILDIYVPQEALGDFTLDQVKEPLKKYIQNTLYKELLSVEGSERPQAREKSVGYKFFIPIIQTGNKQYPITITTPPSEEDIKKGKNRPLVGTYYYYVVRGNELKTLVVSSDPNFNKVMQDHEKRSANKEKRFTRSVEAIEVPGAIHPIDLNKLMGIKTPTKEKPSEETLDYTVRTDYRKGADFEHKKYGKGKIVNTSAGVGGKGDANSRLDWVDVDFGKPFVSGGKLQTVRRIPNIYTKTYFDYPLE